MNRPPAAKRIKEARLKAGLSTENAAKKIGLSIAGYEDLEAYDDEVFTVISLFQLRLLSEMFSIKPMLLVQHSEAQDIEKKISDQELIKMINEKINENAETVEEFSERVGWDVSTAINDSDNIWKDWNLDGLQDICNAVGVNWEYVLNL